MSLNRVQNHLVEKKLVDPEGLARALEAQSRDGGTLARVLADLGIASEEDVCRAIAEALDLEYRSLKSEEPSPDCALLLPPDFCRERRVVPLKIEGRSLRLAMAEPLDQTTIQDVEFRTSKWVKPVVAPEMAIERLLKRLSPEPRSAALSFDLMSEIDPGGELEVSRDDENESLDPTQLARRGELPPIVRLVNMILSDAARAGASDVHIEPQEACVQVRHRVDGMLVDVLTIPKHLHASVVSRLKIISKMDIGERRRPQDGRSRLRVDERRVDLRISTLPTNFGEKVVIRLLDSSGSTLVIEQLGFASELLRAYGELLDRPQGLVLVTGPTGSGKTSTLYASLNWVKDRAKNIITVEDPIEYILPGINQVQVNTRTGVTFAAGLRSILRQDPNIVLVGEIRDRETAGIAMEAAQTGHLILSTLHTNDAPSAITRLVDLGIEPFMIASSLAGVLAQRLVRRPCADCASDRTPSPETLERIGGAARVPEGARWRAGSGCERCRQSGYRGRLSIHELLVVSEEVRGQIHRRAAEHDVRAAARRAGMRTLAEDGIEKAAQGLTTLEEVLRVAPPEERDGGHSPERTSASPPQALLRERAEGSTGSEAAPNDGARARVLIVEDSPTVVTVVKYFLELEGFEVLVAEDGLAGLDLARRSSPRVVVSDINMPGMDGVALVRELRRDPRTREAAILMLTSETSVESETGVLAAGADDYLAKPVEPKRLAARVKAVLARTRDRKRVEA